MAILTGPKLDCASNSSQCCEKDPPVKTFFPILSCVQCTGGGRPLGVPLQYLLKRKLAKKEGERQLAKKEGERKLAKKEGERRSGRLGARRKSEPVGERVRCREEREIVFLFASASLSLQLRKWPLSASQCSPRSPPFRQ